MTGRELIEKLQRLSDAELDLEVYVYTFSEDGNFASEAQVIDGTEEPYHKGDSPWSCGDMKEDEQLIIIR